MLLSSLQMSYLVILSGSGISLGDVGVPSMIDLCYYAINHESDNPKDKIREIMKKVNFLEENEGKNIEAFLSQSEAYLQVKEDKKVRDLSSIVRELYSKMQRILERRKCSNLV